MELDDYLLSIGNGNSIAWYFKGVYLCVIRALYILGIKSYVMSFS